MPSKERPTASHRKMPLYLVMAAVLLALAAMNILAGFPSFVHKAQAAPTIDDPCGISGWVFNDRNADGVFQYGEPVIGSSDVQSSEPGIGDVTISLENPSGVKAAETLSFAGDENTGWFRFQGLAQLDFYTVIETDLPGWASVSPNRQKVPMAGNCVAEVFFGDRRIRSVAGVVFDDFNGNGVQDAGELGVGGVSVSITPQGGGASVDVTTDEFGAYEINDVAVGFYAVVVTVPADYAALSPDTVVTDVTDGGFGTANFALGLADGTIRGTVFLDKHGDGVPESGDEGLAGWNVTLNNASAAAAQSVDQLPITVQTNSQGRFSFPPQPPGVYLVTVHTPAGYVGLTSNVKQVTVIEGRPTVVNMPEAIKSSISGFAFLDQNGDGVQQASEPGLPNVMVELLSDGAVVKTAYTLAGGDYSFTSVSGGTYRVRASAPAGMVATTPATAEVILAADGVGFTSFGYREINTIGGIVFEDLNDNGKRDVGEPGVGNATVTLKNSQGITVGTAVTNGDGSYQFENRSAQAYTVALTLLDGFRRTTPLEVTVTLASNGTGAANFGIKRLGQEVVVYIPELIKAGGATR
jgi:hypothetical protein